ncbi:MAG: DUF599 family protein [Hyphomicrobiales bacterium]|nr:DUF599 family protein [Hyphomicrobiales bacterium]
MLLSIADISALTFFLVAWTLHSLSTEGKLFSRISLSQAMNIQRAAWMRTMARRELRMIDTSIMLGLQQGTAFFGSSALIAVGGCFALIGASDRVLNVLGDLPLSTVASRPVFEVKVIGLILILAYSFFKFGWSYRLFNYCSILIGAVPVHRDDPGHAEEIEKAVVRATKMNVLAGKHFNAGLRGIFFSIGYLGWFVNPVAFALSTLLLLCVLVRRQFFSAARRAVLPGN